METGYAERIPQAARELKWILTSLLIGVPVAFCVAYADSVLLYNYFRFDDVHFLRFSAFVSVGVWLLIGSRRFGDRIKWFGQAATVFRALVAGFVLAAVLAFVDTQLLGDNFDFDDLETTSLGLLLSVGAWCFLVVRNGHPFQIGVDSSTDDTTLVLDADARAEIVRSLRLRANRLQNAARSVLVLIVITLFGGTAMFLTAGQSALGETDPRRIVLTELERQVADLRRLVEIADIDAAAAAIEAAETDAAAAAVAAAAAATTTDDAADDAVAVANAALAEGPPVLVPLLPMPRRLGTLGGQI